jgi:hypothetical protein
MKDKVANTGEDAKNALVEIMKGEIIKPLQRENQTERIEIPQTDRWAVNTQKNCNSRAMLPKIQQYKDYKFIARDSEKVEKYKNFFHKTDNVSIRIPNISKTDETNSFLKLKSII